MRLSLAVLLLCASAIAAADEIPKKIAFLEAKKEEKSPTKRERLQLERKLKRRIGRPAQQVINVWNHWTNEMLVVDANPNAKVSQQTFNDFLRCHFTNRPVDMDVRLVKVLVESALHFKSRRINIVSGYRAPKYNLMLRKKGHEVARDSQHTKGNAVDFRIPHVETEELLDFVKSLSMGGVGFYPGSAFVHADTGKVRYWVGR